MALFKNLAFFTDIHFGRRSNNPDDLADNLAFIEWFVTEAKKRNCDVMIHGGDYFDSRHAIHLKTLNAGLDGLQMLNDAFPQTYFIPGNHDLAFKDKRDVSSIEFARTFQRIEVIRDPVSRDDVVFLPWLVGDEHKSVRSLSGRYAFAHLELPGFMMNARVMMPDHAHGPKDEDFAAQEFVFSGHFHMRQQKGNVFYTGNVMPFNFSDNWDEKRGAMFLTWGGQPEFVTWPGQPLFRTMKLSDLLNRPTELLAPKMTARVTIDVDISFEEAQVIKDTFIDEYGLRKVELAHEIRTEIDAAFTSDTPFQSVDQIVIDGLNAVQSTGLKPEFLVEIYRSLT